MALTIKDLAKIAGVSYATVSRALNNHPEVSAKTRERIRNLAKEHGYSPNEIARGLVKKYTNTIGLLVPDISNPYFPEVAKGVEDKANKEEYTVFLCNTGWSTQKEIEYLKTLRDKRVAGVIIAASSVDTIKKVKALKLDCPIVFVSSRWDDENINYVIIDNEKASMTATEYLIELGYQDIAYIGGNENSVSNKERLIGYKKALKLHGIEKSVYIMKGSSFKRESGYKSMISSIENNRVPEAVICANDIIALGVIEALESRGYDVPNDVSVIGFDDIAYASLPKINLTTIAQPKYDMGAIAADIIFKKIENENSTKANQIVLEPTLIKRGTCKKKN